MKLHRSRTAVGDTVSTFHDATSDDGVVAATVGDKLEADGRGTGTFTLVDVRVIASPVLCERQYPDSDLACITSKSGNVFIDPVKLYIVSITFL